jgi:hypothetical protein
LAAAAAAEDQPCCAAASICSAIACLTAVLTAWLCVQ